MVGSTGVFPRQKLVQAFKSGILSSGRTLDKDQIQPSSLDLRLGKKATCIRSTFLPEDRHKSLEETIDKLRLYDFDLHDSRTNILTRGETYIVPIEETSKLPEGFSGDINPKSTTGRADVMTRVLVDATRKFDTVTPGKHKLYIEVTPLSFNARVKRGTRLDQLRIKYGGSAGVDESMTKMMYLQQPLLYNEKGKPIKLNDVTFRHGGIEMHADLTAPIVAYRAKRNSQLELDLSSGRGVHFDNKDSYWEVIEKPKNGELVLEPDNFYLLATKERSFFPPSLCGTLMAYDVTSAEGRVHYAGFFDPGFFAPATLEVRVYHAPFRIVDGQPICIMLYENMQEEPLDEKGKSILYGSGKYGSNYQHQQRGPNLGKQFLKPKNKR